MRLLLDTHIYRWIVLDDKRLQPKARMLITGAEEVFVSAASIWEASIKAGLGKLHIDIDLLSSLIALSGFEELPVFSRHSLQLTSLPLLHRDPFARLLLAQTLSENLQLVTVDEELSKYGNYVVRV